MPSPPRKWLITPQVFGTHDTAVRWRAANTPSQQVAVRLARLQHEVVYQTRVLMAIRSITRATLAAGIGISDTQLGRILSGAIPMNIAHIVLLEQHFDVTLLTVNHLTHEPRTGQSPNGR